MADPSTADVQAELKEYLNSKNINRCGPMFCRRELFGRRLGYRTRSHHKLVHAVITDAHSRPDGRKASL